MFLPADPVHLAGLRVLSGVAGKLSALAATDIEEMQMAVDEAATLLLPLAAGVDPLLAVTFNVAPDWMHASLSVGCSPTVQVDKRALGWMVLTQLDPDIRLTRDDARVSISVQRRTRVGQRGARVGASW